MKYIFLINPAAGQKDSENELLAQLENRNDFDYQIYYTQSPNDATRFVSETCKNNPNQKYCFVACGGDGTINEVVNGIFGHENGCMTVWPCGSGNDYVKYYGGPECFLNLDWLLKGELMKVDCIRVNERYSLNVASFGFDCAVVETMEKIKRKPLIGGRNAYTTGILTSLFTSTVNRCKVICDGELLNPDGRYLLCTVANGTHVGGAYKCAPRSIVNDGLMEVCLAKTMSFFKMIPLINKYKKGLHLDDPGCAEVIAYRQGKVVEVISEEEMAISVDGELIRERHFHIENLPESVGFIVPTKD